MVHGDEGERRTFITHTGDFLAVMEPQHKTSRGINNGIGLANA